METTTSTIILMTLLLIVTSIYVFGEEELHRKIKRFITRRNWKQKHQPLKFKKNKQSTPGAADNNGAV